MSFALKLVVVGDGAVGKTSLVSTFATGVFPQDYVPTVFDNKVLDVNVDGKVYEVSLWDTAGQEDYDRLRALFYPDADAFVICFSAVDVASAYNIKERWLPELKVYAPNKPFVLVSTKVDLRNDAEVLRQLQSQGTSPVSPDQGRALAGEAGAVAYFETSARGNIGVGEPFREATRQALHCRSKKTGKVPMPKATRAAVGASPATQTSSGTADSMSPAAIAAGVAEQRAADNKRNRSSSSFSCSRCVLL